VKGEAQVVLKSVGNLFQSQAKRIVKCPWQIAISIQVYLKERLLLTVQAFAYRVVSFLHKLCNKILKRIMLNVRVGRIWPSCLRFSTPF